MRKVVLVALVLLALPLLLVIYNPDMRLTPSTLVLGIIGFTVSPLVLFGSLAYMVHKEWRADE